MGSYTVHCNSSPSPIVFNPVNLTTRSKPSHCPHCTSKCFLTETDGWDHYALDLNMSRAITVLMLNKFDRMLDSALALPIGKSSKYEAPKYRKVTNSKNGVKVTAQTTNAELAELAIKTLPPEYSHGVCQLNAHCSGCGSSFVFSISNEPKTKSMPLTYCPYCATQTLVVTPIVATSYVEKSIEDWRFLADMYCAPTENESPEQTLVRIADIRSKYTFWEANSITYKTFAEFMAALPSLIIGELRTPLVHRVTLHSKLRQKPKHLKLRVVKPLPIPAHTYVPAELPKQPEYPHCGICGCETPFNQFKGVCEKCADTTNKERTNPLKYYPLS